MVEGVDNVLSFQQRYTLQCRAPPSALDPECVLDSLSSEVIDQVLMSVLPFTPGTVSGLVKQVKDYVGGCSGNRLTDMSLSQNTL